MLETGKIPENVICFELLSYITPHISKKGEEEIINKKQSPRGSGLCRLKHMYFSKIKTKMTINMKYKLFLSSTTVLNWTKQKTHSQPHFICRVL